MLIYDIIGKSGFVKCLDVWCHSFFLSLLEIFVFTISKTKTNTKNNNNNKTNKQRKKSSKQTKTIKQRSSIVLVLMKFTEMIKKSYWNICYIIVCISYHCIHSYNFDFKHITISFWNIFHLKLYTYAMIRSARNVHLWKKNREESLNFPFFFLQLLLLMDEKDIIFISWSYFLETHLTPIHYTLCTHNK